MSKNALLSIIMLAAAASVRGAGVAPVELVKTPVEVQPGELVCFGEINLADFRGVTVAVEAPSAPEGANLTAYIYPRMDASSRYSVNGFNAGWFYAWDAGTTSFIFPPEPIPVMTNLAKFCVQSENRDCSGYPACTQPVRVTSYKVQKLK